MSRCALAWMLLTLFAVILLQASCHASSDKSKEKSINGCHDKNWKYDSHSETCIEFKEEQKGHTWSQARDDCKRYESGGKKGNLIVIKDEMTNSFVRDNIFPRRGNYFAWIGLFKNGKNWNWHNSSEVVNYTRWDSQTTEGMYAFMVSRSGMWRKHKGTQTLLRWICQYDAVKRSLPKKQVTCPSPVQENNKMVEAMVCGFPYENATKVKWKSKKTGEYIVPCQWTDLCGSVIENTGSFSISLKQNETGFASAKYGDGDPVTRDMEDTWTCSIFMDYKLLDNQTCNIRVYEPALNIKCNSILLPEQINISCSTDKIYPKAMCRLWYRWNESAQFQPMTTDGQSFTRQHNGITIYKRKYFSSTCRWIVRSSSSMAIHPGILEVKVQMYPDIDTFDLQDNVEAIREGHHNITIERPDKPIFTHVQGEANSSYTVPEGETLRLSCEIQNGKPKVESTTIQCQFPVQNSNTGIWTMKGNSSVIEADVTKDLDGKTCTCWGTHITGKNESTMLVIYVITGKGRFNGTEEGSNILEGGNEATDTNGSINKMVILIVAVCSGVFVVIVCLSMTVVVCRKRKRQKKKMETDNVNPAEELPVTVDEDPVLEINDIYHTGNGVAEQFIREDEGGVAGSKDDEYDINERPYANTTCSTNHTSDADDKSCGKRKRRRADELVYVELEFDNTTSGTDRKVKVKFGDHQTEYASIDFQKSAPMNEEIDD